MILWALSKMDLWGTQAYGPKNKEINDDAQGVTIEGRYWQILYVKINNDSL